MSVILLAAILSCPGKNTLEMQACEAQKLTQSNAILKEKITEKDFADWTNTREKLCALSKKTLVGGSIYGQLLLSCSHRLNQALINQFSSLADTPNNDIPTNGKLVHCVIDSETGHSFEGGCQFVQFGGNGSFHLRNAFINSELLPGVPSYSILLNSRGHASIRYKYTTLSGQDRVLSSPAVRSKKDPSCWITRGLSICAY